MRAALYTRVSTNDQSTESQRREMIDLAMRRKWIVVKEFTDQGISGAKGREQRPGLDEMLKASTGGEFDVIMVWAVDRLGRSLGNLIHTLQDLDKAKVGLYIHQQNLDTTTPAGRAMFQMLGVFAEFERSLIQTRVKSGMAKMKSEGRRPGPKGIEYSSPDKYNLVVKMLKDGIPPWRVHQDTGAGHSTVLRIRDDIKKEAANG
jgi:DNA invertase Pin-like site-specific DNA recombinase